MLAAEALSAAVTYRPATERDIPSLVDLAIKGLQKDPYPGLVIDRQKVYEMAKYVLDDVRHFCWVAEHEGTVVAALSAVTQPMTFHHRREAQVVQYWTDKPGCGVVLLRKFLRWARARPGVKCIMVTVEHGADPRIHKLMERLGLRMQVPTYMETR